MVKQLRVLIGMQIEYQPIKSLCVVNKADGKTIESIDWHADWISTNQITHFIMEKEKAETGLKIGHCKHCI